MDASQWQKILNDNISIEYWYLLINKNQYQVYKFASFDELFRDIFFSFFWEALEAGEDPQEAVEKWFGVNDNILIDKYDNTQRVFKSSELLDKLMAKALLTND